MPSRKFQGTGRIPRNGVRSSGLPDGSVGISREPWLKVAQEWLDEARLRGSQISPTVADLVVPTGNPIRLASRRQIG